MIYCFDIDGTICTNTNGHYDQALPYPERIAQINKLYESGETIHLYTARGSTTGIDWREFTESQLAQWHLKYHKLMLKKPHYDLMIDDKSVSDTSFFMPEPLKSTLNKYASSLNFQHFNQLDTIAQTIIDVFNSNGTLFLAGNGGSYSQAEHFGGELTGRFLKYRRPLPAYVLGSNHVSMTAISNDYSYQQVFSREFDALCSGNDLLISFSTSGTSPNILTLHDQAKLSSVPSI